MDTVERGGLAPVKTGRRTSCWMAARQRQTPNNAEITGFLGAKTPLQFLDRAGVQRNAELRRFTDSTRHNPAHERHD
jgi:hypothetical protein